MCGRIGVVVDAERFWTHVLQVGYFIRVGYSWSEKICVGDIKLGAFVALEKAFPTLREV